IALDVRGVAVLERGDAQVIGRAVAGRRVAVWVVAVIPSAIGVGGCSTSWTMYHGNAARAPCLRRFPCISERDLDPPHMGRSDAPPHRRRRGHVRTRPSRVLTSSRWSPAATWYGALVAHQARGA